MDKTLPYTVLQWVNFYGPSSEASNKEYENIYQFFPHLAPYYIGSLLIRCTIFEKDLPERKVVRMKDIIPKQKKVFY